MNTSYEIEIAGLKRELDFFPLTDKLQIAGFICYHNCGIEGYSACV